MTALSMGGSKKLGIGTAGFKGGNQAVLKAVVHIRAEAACIGPTQRGTQGLFSPQTRPHLLPFCTPSRAGTAINPFFPGDYIQGKHTLLHSSRGNNTWLHSREPEKLQVPLWQVLREEGACPLDLASDPQLSSLAARPPYLRL